MNGTAKRCPGKGLRLGMREATWHQAVPRHHSSQQAHGREKQARYSPKNGEEPTEKS